MEEGLSDEDIKRLAEELEGRLMSRFYRNVGSGVLSLAWKGIVMGIIALAVYGAAKNGWSL